MMRDAIRMGLLCCLLPQAGFAAGPNVIGTVLPGPTGRVVSGSALLATAGNTLTGVFANTGGLGCGSVVRFKLASGGTLQKSVLYEFSGDDACVDTTWSTKLVADAAGNLYGANRNEIYKLSPPAGGGVPWVKKSLYSHSGDVRIMSPLTFVPGSQTALVYAVQYRTAGSPYGAVEVLSNLGATPVQSVLHQFSASTDAHHPSGPVLAASFNGVAGYYGVSYDGGSANKGAVYRLLPGAVAGSYSEDVIYNFTGGADGLAPVGNLLSRPGTTQIYGVASEGGNVALCSRGCGTVYRLKVSAAGAWTQSVIWTFDATGPNTDGAIPMGGLAWDGPNLVGVTQDWGTAPNAVGSAYRLTKSGNVWTETILGNFTLSQAAMRPTQVPAVINHALYGAALWNDFSSASVWQIK